MAEEHLAPDGVPIPRMRMTEIGYSGLNVSAGIIYEEAKSELRWPQSVRTFKEMRRDPTIAAALKAFELLVSRVPWCVKAPPNATDRQKKRTDFVQQCQNDMEHSWFSFMKEVVSVFTFGYDIHEICYRRRRIANGSKWNDGLWGWQKLPQRSQDSVNRWLFDESGRYLTGVEQLVAYNYYGQYSRNAGTPITLPREKLLLFRTDALKGNPEGQSPLVNCYLPYKIRSQLEEIEAVGYSKNVNGVPVVWLHPKYMAEDASDADKAVYEHYKQLVRNLHVNEQTGIIMPLMYDSETKQKLFDFQLLSVDNPTAQYLHESITRWDNKILTTLAADVLRLGQDKMGSYSLADSKTNLLSMAIEARLLEIRDVLNTELIPQLYKVNGWVDEAYPTFEFGDIEDEDIEAFSKALQRAKAVGLITPTAGNVNRVAEVLKLPDRVPEDIPQEELTALLGKSSTRSGDSFNTDTGGLNGTANSVSISDTSTQNLENSA